MTSLNRLLFKILSISWLSFAVAGTAIFFLFPTPQITVLIDRSYCPPDKWQQLVQTYTGFYQKHQNRDIQIKAVVVFSELGQEVLAAPPAPEIVLAMNTYGRASLQKQQSLSSTYTNAQFLTCPLP